MDSTTVHPDHYAVDAVPWKCPYAKLEVPADRVASVRYVSYFPDGGTIGHGTSETVIEARYVADFLDGLILLPGKAPDPTVPAIYYDVTLYDGQANTLSSVTLLNEYTVEADGKVYYAYVEELRSNLIWIDITLERLFRLSSSNGWGSLWPLIGITVIGFAAMVFLLSLAAQKIGVIFSRPLIPPAITAGYMLCGLFFPGLLFVPDLVLNLAFFPHSSVMLPFMSDYHSIPSYILLALVLLMQLLMARKSSK